MKRILLFDIDGTLIRTGSVFTDLHTNADIESIRKVLGIRVTHKEVEAYGGMTDMGVITELLKDKGVGQESISKNISDVFQYMRDYFSMGIGKINTDDVVFSDVIVVLERFSRDRNYVLGLLTGNIKEIARMKLQKLELWDYFKIGGFGDSSTIRSKLIPIALMEALNKKLVEKVNMEQVYVIGDTKHDIVCAKEGGVISVAVATGLYPKGALETYNPNYLLENLSELFQVLR